MGLPSGNGREKIRAQFWMCLIILLAMALLTYAASFSYFPDPNAVIFNLSEDSNFFYDLNVTATESLVLYSSNAQE